MRGRPAEIELIKNQEKLIKIINENPGISFNKLTEKLGWSKPTVRKRLDKLIEQGLIHEEKPERFGQRSRLYSTELSNLYEIFVSAFEGLKEIIDLYIIIITSKIKKAKPREWVIIFRTLYNFVTSRIYGLMAYVFTLRFPEETEHSLRVHALEVLKHYFVRTGEELKEVKYPSGEVRIFEFDLKDTLSIFDISLSPFPPQPSPLNATEALEEADIGLEIVRILKDFRKESSIIFEKLLIKSIPDYDKEKKLVKIVIADKNFSEVMVFRKRLKITSPDRLNLFIELFWIEFYLELFRFLEKKLKEVIE